MCDCYSHKCEVCEETIPMHINDFDDPRDAFKVWCQKHVKYAYPGAIVYTLEANAVHVDDHHHCPKGWRCAILGPDSGTPNVGVDWLERRVEE